MNSTIIGDNDMRRQALSSVGRRVAFILLLVATVCCSGLASDWVYFRNIVQHTDGSLCTHTPPITSFVCFLNRNESKILIENAPRWSTTGGPNIEGNGTFGAELGNFASPSLQVGDSVFMRFTCTATQQQGALGDSVSAIPWFRFPITMQMAAAALPTPPQDVLITSIDTVTNHRTISWRYVAGATYTLYRRTAQDTLPDGRSRMLYTRLAESITTGSYADTLTDVGKKYGYIVFAVSPQGVMSAHSEEANESTGFITGLAVQPRATTVILSWRPFTSTTLRPKGYNIYRRSASGIYGSPIAYVGLDTTFIDSRLGLGATYYYKVKARYDEHTEVAVSNEVAATTLSSQAGLYTYANLKVAVVVYQNTTRGGISNADVEKIKTMLDIGKLFYWRNSGMKLNIQFTYVLITDLRNFGDPNNTNVAQTVADLDSLGVMNTQYDIIFRVNPATAGYWSYGVMDLGLPGPSRQTGFSHSEWPVGSGVIYPGHLPGINYGLTWIFVHECQHAIDDLYRVNAHPEMYHGDAPHEFPVACGEHYDFQAKIFRTFSSYEELFANWGSIYEAGDADNDGFPDDEPLVALDETRFGSSPELIDTDTDGLTDRMEAMSGNYAGSNPNSADTDRDGIPDGQDRYPRFPLRENIQQFRPTIDGTIEPGWPIVNDTVSYTQTGYRPQLYMSYDTTALYLAFYLPNIAFPEISLDFRSDGWWWGTGNTIMKINISTGTFLYFHSWDASPEVRAYSGGGGMWDDDPDYQAHFNRRVIYPNTVQLVSNISGLPVVQIEMKIPKRPFAGLTLQQGDSLKININYTKVNNDPYQWATTFDQYDFAKLILGGTVDVNEQPVASNLPNTFSLEQNYPNPFNPTTTFSFSIPYSSFVILKVFDVLGREVGTLVNEERRSGTHSVEWDASGFASGVYFYRLQSGGLSETRKLILAR